MMSRSFGSVVTCQGRRSRWKAPLRCLTPTAGVLLLTAAFCAPSASATLVGEVASTAGSVVESATGAPAPSVPGTPPTPDPPSPAPEQAPVDPVKASTEAASTYSHEASSLPKDAIAEVGGGASAAGEAATDATESTAAAAGTSTETTSSTPAAAGSQSRPSFPGAPAAPGNREPSSKTAQATPVGWFLAYVWPAIALDPRKGLVANLVAGLKASDPLPSSDAAVTPPEAGGGARAGGSPPLREQLETPKSTSGASLGETLASGAKTLLYAAAAALLALLAFTAWAELSSAIRSRSVIERQRGF